MKKNLVYYVLALVVVVGAVAAAYFAPSQQFQGYLGGGTKEHVAGATCVPFVTPVKGGLRKQGEFGVHSVNFKNCKDAKIKTLRYNLQGQHLDLQSVKLMKNGSDVTASLTQDSQAKLMELRNTLNQANMQKVSLDLQFRDAVTLSETDTYNLHMRSNNMYADSYLSTSLQSFEYMDATNRTATYAYQQPVQHTYTFTEAL